MKFIWDNGEWYQGEEPKPKTLKEWMTGNVHYIVVGLIALAVWWWFDGSERIFGDISKVLTPPRHLNMRIR